MVQNFALCPALMEIPHVQLPNEASRAGCSALLGGHLCFVFFFLLEAFLSRTLQKSRLYMLSQSLNSLLQAGQQGMNITQDPVLPSRVSMLHTSSLEVLSTGISIL